MPQQSQHQIVQCQQFRSQTERKSKSNASLSSSNIKPLYAITFCLADADVIHPLKSPNGIRNGKSTVSSITDSKFHHAPKAPTSPETPAAC